MPLVQGEEWRAPAPLQLEVQSSRGAQSVEKDVQERREMETLSANYLQIAYIPPSPAEPKPEPEAINATPPRPIALFQVKKYGLLSSFFYCIETSLVVRFLHKTKRLFFILF